MLLRLHCLSPPLLPPPIPNRNEPSQNPKIPRRPLPPLRPLSISSNTTTTTDSGLLFREKLLYLQTHLGVDPIQALSLNPSLRTLPLSSLLSLASLLSSFGFRLPDDSSRPLSMYPHLLSEDPSSSLLPVFRFLLGPAAIPLPHLRLSVVRCPRLLVSSVPHQLLPSLYFLRRLGFVGPHKITSHTTLLLVSSVENTLIPKLDFIQSLGFSSRDTQRMVLRSPALLTFSVDNNFKPKVEFLVGEMGRDVMELKRFPQYFSFSLEGRIRPRHQVLVENGVRMMPLPDMLRTSDGEFRERVLEMRLGLGSGDL